FPLPSGERVRVRGGRSSKSEFRTPHPLAEPVIGPATSGRTRWLATSPHRKRWKYNWLWSSRITRRQTENPSRLARRRHLIAENMDDVCRLLDQRRIAGRELTLLQIDIVLQSDARMAAEQHRLRHHRELMQRNAERKPRRLRRQQVAHIGHGFGGCRLAPGNAEADLKHARRLDVAVLDETLGKEEMP